MDQKLIKHMTYVPVSEATQPRNGVYQIRKDYYWSVVDKDGIDCIMLYRGYSPQCNSDKSIVEQVNGRLYPEAKIVQLPVVYVPWEC